MFHAALGLAKHGCEQLAARQPSRGMYLEKHRLTPGFQAPQSFQHGDLAYYGMSPTRLVSSEKSLCFDSESNLPEALHCGRS